MSQRCDIRCTTLRVDTMHSLKKDVITVEGDLIVEGKLTATNLDLDRDSIIDEVLDGLPFGPLEKCHGCDRKSYGFQWDAVGAEGGESDRQMCLECMYQVMRVERVKRAQHDLETK